MSDSIKPQPEAATSSGTDPIIKKLRIAGIPVLLAAGAYGYFHRNAVDCGSSGAQDLVVQIAKDHNLLASALGASHSPIFSLNADDAACRKDASCARAIKDYDDALKSAAALSAQCKAIPAHVESSDTNTGSGSTEDLCPDVSATAEDVSSRTADSWGTTYYTGDSDNGWTPHFSARHDFMAANAQSVSDRLKAAADAKSQAKKELENAMLRNGDAAWDKIASAIQYRLENIIMTDKNDETGAVMCKATLFGSVVEWGEKSRNIQYSVEKTSDGKLFATLFGG